jgi:signal transduction histidine kinase
MTTVARGEAIVSLGEGGPGMLPHGRATILFLAGFGALVVLVAEALYLPGLSLYYEDAVPRVVVDAAVGGAYIAMGVFAWARRPDSRVGLLLYVAGCLFFAGNFAWVELAGVHQVAIALSDVSVIFIGMAVIGYPTGRLEGTAPRVLAVVATVWTLTTGFLNATQLDPAVCRAQSVCPPNPFRVDLGPAFAGNLDQAGQAGGTVLWLAFLGLVAARWWHATPAARRMLRPLWIAATLIGVSRVGEIVVGALLGPVAQELYVTWVSMPALIGVPVALAYGLVRGRLEQAAVGDLVVRLRATTPDRPLATNIAEAIGDPGLELAFPGPHGSLVDADGDPVPALHGTRRATVVEGTNGPLAVLIHDASLDANPGLIRSVAAAAGLAIENERLADEIEAQLEEVRASRARLAEAAVEERARLERDLHDGAQQRLVALALRLRSIAADAPDAQTAGALDGAATELDEALAELRELARGIHPTAVVQGGLAGAVESLAQRAPLPVDLHVSRDRWPLAIEVGAWFVIAEALTNAARHAGATRVAISAAEQDGVLVVTITDDGIGGADPAGAGLTGLADRVAALGGTLVVGNAHGGRGTIVRADLPVAS